MDERVNFAVFMQIPIRFYCKKKKKDNFRDDKEIRVEEEYCFNLKLIYMVVKLHARVLIKISGKK